MKLLMIESLADNIDLSEAIEEFGLQVIESDSLYAKYDNDNRLIVEITFNEKREGINYYNLKINDKNEVEVPEDLLDSFIMEELQML